jgi:hypothetical protein
MVADRYVPPKVRQISTHRNIEAAIAEHVTAPTSFSGDRHIDTSLL